MKHMKPAMIITTIIALCFVGVTIGGLIYDRLHASNMGATPFFQEQWVGILLCVVFGVFALVQLVCLFTTRFSISKIGFHVFHFGMILFLLSSFIFFVSGDKGYFNVKVGQSYNGKIQFSKLGEADLGFGLQIKSLQVARYEPDEETGIAADKMVSTQLVIYPDDGSASHEHLLYINGPYSENGYKIYLMNYDRAAYENGGEQTVTLLIKKNPGEIPTLIACAMMVIGSFIMAFGRTSLPQNAKGGKKHANP